MKYVTDNNILSSDIPDEIDDRTVNVFDRTSMKKTKCAGCLHRMAEKSKVVLL